MACVQGRGSRLTCHGALEPGARAAATLLCGRRETVPATCRAAEPGSAGQWWRVRGGILPTGPGEPPSAHPASAARHGRTGHASQEPDVLASARQGFPECHPRNVLWLCRKPCGVSPSLTGSQHASGTSSGAGSPLPGQWSAPVLWAMILPSRRSLTAYPHDGQRPVFSVPISRAVPRPAGGSNGSPGTAGGH